MIILRSNVKDIILTSSVCHNGEFEKEMNPL